MKKIPLLFLGLLLFSRFAFCEDLPVRIESSSFSDHEQTLFRDELSRVARKSFELGQKRFSKIKSINDSYQLTSKAIQLLADRGDVAGAILHLKEASQKYDGNRMAFLLLGAALERAGRQEEAAQAYAGFYRYSLTLVPEENKLIRPSSLQIFRGYVEKRFAEWGRTLPEPKVALNIRQARSLVMLEGSRVGQRINLVLPLLVVAGLGVWLLAHILGLELPKTASFFLRGFYLWFVLAYLLWAAHFFLGLPFFVSLETEFLFFFGAGIVIILLFYSIACFRVAFKRQKKIEGAKRCSYCNELILLLAVECPKCRRPCGDS